MKNSIATYYDAGNQRIYMSHRARIVRYLRKNPSKYSYQIANHLGLSNEQVQKRLSDEAGRELFEVSGTTFHLGNPISQYSVIDIDQLSLFKEQKKPTLKSWLKNNHPEILFKYDAIINHEI